MLTLALADQNRTRCWPVPEPGAGGKYTEGGRLDVVGQHTMRWHRSSPRLNDDGIRVLLLHLRDQAQDRKWRAQAPRAGDRDPHVRAGWRTPLGRRPHARPRPNGGSIVKGEAALGALGGDSMSMPATARLRQPPRPFSGLAQISPD